MSRAQPTLRLGRPFWLERTADRATRYPRLSGAHQTDVAIVGGGMTGALIAHAFASAGISTTVLEASAIGTGSTAASAALLLQEPDLGLTELTRRYGGRTARRIWQVSHDSVRELVSLLKRLRIACDLRQRDTLYYATDADAAERLRKECDLRRHAGFEAMWLGPAALRHVTGISGGGAIRTRGNAQFDPYRACLGVLRAAVREGARVFERSRVRRIRTDRHRVRLWTSDGTIEAERVIIATGYATREFRPLAGRFRMYRTYALATAPIGGAARRELGLPDVMVWDTERPYHYARWTPGHRLLVGGGDRLVHSGPRRRREFATAVEGLRTYVKTRFPVISSIDMEFAWEGLFAMTPDTLPYIGPHRRYPRHWFALGYGGNGMTFALLAARLLLERWRGMTSRDHALFEFGRGRK